MIYLIHRTCLLNSEFWTKTDETNTSSIIVIMVNKEMLLFCEDNWPEIADHWFSEPKLPNRF